MMKRTLLILAAAAILTATGCSASRDLTVTKSLYEKIEERFSDSLFAHAFWGVKIESLTSGRVIYERNADKMFMPASNQKILTTAAALLTLGPEFKFETNLYYNGVIQDSILNGDLIVAGNGDPTFYTRFFNDPRDLFFFWADTLKKIGIKKITGNIIGDDNAFDDNHLGTGWAYDNLDTWYSAEVGALQFNENYIDLKIIPPADIYGNAEIIPNIPSSYFNIINDLKINCDTVVSVSVTRPLNENTITVSGNLFAGGRVIENSPSIHNPTLFFTTVLKETLDEKGIEVEGSAIDCDEIVGWFSNQSGFSLIHTHYSPPLKEILKGLMKRSQNMYAETMVRTMGWQRSGIGSFDEGKKVVEEVLAGFGIKPDTYAYVDGSGLTRYDYISPNQVIKILKGMKQSKERDIWLDLFPIAGIDGTLRLRMKGTRAEGNVRAKTGTISNVRGLSGYLTTENGEEIVFSFLVNGHLRSGLDTEKITDSVLEILTGKK
ncbi:MAG: D-alanyl-D-alanine carboxypeptidase/D-alanyl-D-alanine-endopeptidase [Melioribacteraceae bacterium]|nr:D-alanyl-D-alanine carboxypeptidase/D-alanyl-D-alanine-endopeptidase [Melioribacteraceae bacterium]